jgi:peptidyl-prolyl cis-trans isomerase C
MRSDKLKARQALVRSCRALAAAALVLAAGGCDSDALEPRAVDAGPPPAGLTNEQAASVVAKVGDATITLGDFAAALERMNQFDRLRYQTRERRRELLTEMVSMELLAQEAKRRRLDKEPAVQEAVRQILREAMLAEARKGLPAPAAIPASEVKKYYDAHLDEFVEPERRRVSVIQMKDADKAAEVLEKVLADPEQWGALYLANSIDAPDKPNPRAPADLAGDRGIVGPPHDPKGESSTVPEPVRRAVFNLSEIGDVFGKAVVYDREHYIVRLSGKSAGHTRSVVEADRAIRVAILQQMVRDREAALEVDLRKRFPVRIDDKALQGVSLPKGLESYRPFWEEGPPGGAEAPDGDKPDDGP